MKKIFVILVLFTLFSCNDESDLGSNYYYLPDYESVDIGYPYGTVIYKSEEKNHFDEIVIYSDIKKINFNKKFIIVLQKPNKELMIKNIEDDLLMWNNHYLTNMKDTLVDFSFGKMSSKRIYNLINRNKTGELHRIAESLFNDGILKKKGFANFENYYIIQKQNDSIFGPYNFEKFTKIKYKKNIDLDFN